MIVASTRKQPLMQGEKRKKKEKRKEKGKNASKRVISRDLKRGSVGAVGNITQLRGGAREADGRAVDAANDGLGKVDQNLSECRDR